MIQYIGPSDNEYIYIDFSVLPYDVKKWEFPRENLEFGRIQIVSCEIYSPTTHRLI